MKNKQIIPAIIFFATLIVFIYYSTKNAMSKEKSIDEFEINTVALVTKFYRNRSYETYYYTFYYKGKKYQNSEHINEFDGQNLVGKYYFVRLSSENPNYAEIFLDKEIHDTLEISKAGFR
jgi:hypothetical protein